MLFRNTHMSSPAVLAGRCLGTRQGTQPKCFRVIDDDAG